jgi:hypothetical protein
VGARCTACGCDTPPLPREDAGGPWPTGGAASSTLERAFEAFRDRDYPRMVAHLVGAEGWPSRAVTTSQGPGWIVTVGRALVFLGLDLQRGRVMVEAPIAHLPERQRVPALRVALELSARLEHACRFLLRRELLVLGFAGPLAETPPDFLRLVVIDVAASSESAAPMFRARFDARLAIADPRSGAVDWTVLGERRALARLAPPRAAVRDGEPRAPTDSIPPILAPRLAGTTATARATTPQLDGATSADRAQARVTLHELQLDAVWRGLPDAAGAEVTEASRLCDLLRRAHALVGATGIDDQPAIRALLIRATVFRSIHGFGTSLPDAVAHLYRATAAATRQTWTTDARQSMVAGAAGRPMVEVLDRLIAAGAQVPKERPLAVDPLTTAAEAREHLKHYVGAIEGGPDDLPIRHFLALGALTELIFRTKLPAPTEQRLREIVAHAERDEPRAASLTLMMTALGRIIAP